MTIPPQLLQRLFDKADLARWRVSPASFAEALDASARRAFGASEPSARALAQYLEGLHLADLALACACAAGLEAAWEHFIREHRPALYRAADALDPTGAARDLADTLYGDLYGTAAPDGVRRSLFRYFHGRSSLATWLRAVLAQRHVDLIRARRRTEPLPPEDQAPAGPVAEPDLDRRRLVRAVHAALTAAVALLPPRDRLRLRSYYVSGLTLAQIGRLLGEHEATVSRHLKRTRSALRLATERHVREHAGLADGAIADALQQAAEVDPESMLDLHATLGGTEEPPPRRVPDRSGM